ncbi:MAG: alpha/beta fold hydrolase [Pseudomonadota bacterium]
MRTTIAVLLLLGSTPLAANECVILLHGLARSASSMEEMQEALEEEGYFTANVDYPSRDYAVEHLAPMAVETGLADCREQGDVHTIHFVTHSLGGILVRQYLSEFDITELGRVVMLGPPNQGSAAVDELKDVPGFDWINGPAGRQLGKGEWHAVLALGPANFELGVIAGTRTIDPFVSAVLENPDDGRVSLEDTKIDGMDDFAIVKHSHAYMMKKRKPIELTKRFLRSGKFEDADRS